jgi:Do/DeqQ family serine protease
MKQFFGLVLAAVLGSGITLAVVEWREEKNPRRVELTTAVPSSAVAYTTNEKGEVVPMDFTGVAEKVTQAVVHIRSRSEGRATADSRDREMDPFRFFFGPGNPFEQRQGPSQSTGSGVIINANGYIVTNNHVVKGADQVTVTLHDNREFKAEVIGTDPDTDLAVLKVNQKDLPFLAFVNSDLSKVGQWVLAVGNPFNLNSTVTAGIISAKGRNINIINSGRSNQDGTPTRTAIESFIQTDAAINPGNSGGALVDLNGGLLGINTAIASPTGAYSGYGFAVPSNIVSKVVEDLITFGTVQRGWLGIEVRSVDSELAKAEDLSVTEGAYVNGFGDFEDKSAAKSAGIQKGDVIVRLDNTPIKTSTALIEFIGRKRPGDKVEVTVNRGGKEKTFTAILKNREGSITAVKPEEKGALAALGIELEDADPKLLKQMDLTHGVRVKNVTTGKISRYTEIEKGFIITDIDNVAVKSAKQANEILSKKKPGDRIIISGYYPDSPRELIFGLRM